MSTVKFNVPVAASPDEVAKRLNDAAQDPSEFVHMFTTSNDIDADVAEGRNGVWRIRVEGPQFRSRGTTSVRPHGDDGSDIEINIDLRGKGLMGLASPLLMLASGRIEEEATEALQKEFGPPT